MLGQLLNAIAILCGVCVVSLAVITVAVNLIKGAYTKDRRRYPRKDKYSAVNRHYNEH